MAHQKKDRWTQDGRLSLEGDYLFYLPSIKNPPFNLEYWRQYRPWEYQQRTEKRGFQLGMRPDPENMASEAVAVDGLKKIPTPLFWAILEADPSAAVKTYTLLSGKGNYGIFSPTLRVVDPYRDRDQRAAKVMDVWEKVEVDKEIFRLIQNKVVVYLEEKVAQGEMPEGLLKTARGILRFYHTAPIAPDLNELRTHKKQTGETSENPKIEFDLGALYPTDKWEVKGELRQEDEHLVYQDERLKHQNRQRQITIAALDAQDQNRQNFVLTKTAWKILLHIPSSYYSGGISTERPFLDKKGRWKVEVKTIEADGETLVKMQKFIREYINKQVAAGRMNSDILTTVDGIQHYKHSTLELGYDPVSHSASYRIKAKEGHVRTKPMDLIDKVAKEVSNRPEATGVEVTGDDIKKYLQTKQLPAGSSIQNLQIEAGDSQAIIKGVIDVPIPFFGGKVEFNLELTNGLDGKSLLVKSSQVVATSGQLRKRLADFERQLGNITAFILDDLNRQLRTKGIEVSGITITRSGNFSLNIQKI